MAACPDLQNQPVSAARPPLPLPRPVVGTRSRARQKPSRVWVGQGGRAVATERAMTPSLFSLQGPALREGSRFQARAPLLPAPLLPAPASRPSSDRLAATGCLRTAGTLAAQLKACSPDPWLSRWGFCRRPRASGQRAVWPPQGCLRDAQWSWTLPSCWLGLWCLLGLIS